MLKDKSHSSAYCNKVHHKYFHKKEALRGENCTQKKPGIVFPGCEICVKGDEIKFSLKEVHVICTLLAF